MNLNLDLDAMLENMTKEAIMAQISTEVDKAIVKKIEKETEKRLFKELIARVANDSYTQDDVNTLQKCLVDRRRREYIENGNQKTVVPQRYRPTPVTPIVPPTGARVLGSEEFASILQELENGRNRD